jgi:hypothetical protein
METDVMEARIKQERQTQLLNEVESIIATAARRQKNQSRAGTVIYGEIGKLFPADHSQRDFVLILVMCEMDRVIELAAAGQYPWAYVELCAALEAVMAKVVAPRLAKQGFLPTTFLLIKTLSLKQIAPHCVHLGWTDDDVAFAQRLWDIRDATIERDVQSVAMLLGRRSRGKTDAWEAVHVELERVAADIARVIALIVKIAKPHKRKFNGRRTVAS